MSFILDEVKKMVEVDLGEEIYDAELQRYILNGFSVLKQNNIPTPDSIVISENEFNDIYVEKSHAGIVLDYLHLYTISRFDRNMLTATSEFVKQNLFELLMILKSIYEKESQDSENNRYYTKEQVDDKDQLILQESKDYTDKKISEIPPVDLSGYFTSEETKAEDAKILITANTYTNDKIESLDLGDHNIIEAVHQNDVPLVITNKIVNVDAYTKEQVDGKIPTEIGDKNIIEIIKQNGTALTITDKSVDIDAYTKTDTYTKEEVNDIVSAIKQMNIEVVDQLPTENISTTTIYFVPKPTQANNYDEYMYIKNNWEQLGNTTINLANYYTKEEIDTKLDEQFQKGIQYADYVAQNAQSAAISDANTYTNTQVTDMLAQAKAYTDTEIEKIKNGGET